MYSRKKQIKMLSKIRQRYIDNFPIDKNKSYIEQCKELFEKYPDSFSKILMTGYKLYEIDSQYVPPFKYLVDWINEQTPLLQDSIYGFSTKLYWIFNELEDFPVCMNQNCSNKIGIGVNVKVNRGYPEYCCNRCAQTDERIIRRVKETKFKNHGDENYVNIDSIIQTNLKNYGVEYSFQSKEVIEKCRQTKQKHIEENPNYWKDRQKKTNSTIQKCVDENPNYWKERQLKIEQTKIANGHDPHWCNSEKANETRKNNLKLDSHYYDESKQRAKTTIEKHKAEDPQYQEKIITKCKATKKKNHGDENYVNVEKCRQTKMKNHGNPNWNNYEKARQTCITLYGMPSYMPYGSQRFKDRMIELYGVEHNSQCHEFRIKQQQKYFYENQWFGSSWEISLYIWLTDNHKDFSYQPDLDIWYEFDGCLHKYEPDFLIDGKIIEIKGDHFFNDDGTMKCPYRKKTWTDEQYEKKCQQYEAKHQCMITNNVVILKKKDCQKYIDYVEQTYGKGYLKQFKKKLKNSKIQNHDKTTDNQ